MIGLKALGHVGANISSNKIPLKNNKTAEYYEENWHLLHMCKKLYNK